MARTLTQQEIELLQSKTIEAIEKKRKAQAKQGKDFIVDSEGHHSGVIPEKIWKNLPGKKDQDNG